MVKVNSFMLTEQKCEKAIRWKESKILKIILTFWSKPRKLFGTLRSRIYTFFKS